METTIFLGRELLSGDAATLHRILRAHTQCDRSAAELLQSVERGRREGRVRYCVLRAPGTPAGDGHGWAVQFSYAD